MMCLSQADSEVADKAWVLKEVHQLGLLRPSLENWLKQEVAMHRRLDFQNDSCLPVLFTSPPPEYWSKRKCNAGSTNTAPLKGAYSEPLTLPPAAANFPFCVLAQFHRKLCALLSATSKLRDTFATQISQVYNTYHLDTLFFFL